MIGSMKTIADLKDNLQTLLQDLDDEDTLQVNIEVQRD